MARLRGHVAEDASKVGSGQSGRRRPARRPAKGATGGSDGADGSSQMRDGRLQPDQPARAYLAVIARDPEHVRKALQREPV